MDEEEERERGERETRQQLISVGLRTLDRGEHCTLSFPAFIYNAWSKQSNTQRWGGGAGGGKREMVR